MKGFNALDALGALMASLSLALQIETNLLWYCVFLLFDTIHELHAMDGKNMLNEFLIGKWHTDFTRDKGLYIHYLFCVCGGGIYHIKLKIL